MIAWLTANAGTVLVALVLLSAVALILAGMRRDRRQGRTSCGCSCENCALHGQCHTAPPLKR
ncbi:MAG: FeoB-associated Cys-rich membrane protein [Oscillospiraceae bacterium]|nr:FeoB-associated Cys-rich membrane protein [Oscillospiraceae bacterium]